jgi:hypothetical protein
MALFGKFAYNNWAMTLTGGKTSVSNKDALHPDYSVMGSGDSEYCGKQRHVLYRRFVMCSKMWQVRGEYHSICVTYSDLQKRQLAGKDSTRNLWCGHGLQKSVFCGGIYHGAMT